MSYDDDGSGGLKLMTSITSCNQNGQENQIQKPTSTISMPKTLVSFLQKKETTMVGHMKKDQAIRWSKLESKNIVLSHRWQQTPEDSGLDLSDNSFETTNCEKFNENTQQGQLCQMQQSNKETKKASCIKADQYQNYTEKSTLPINTPKNPIAEVQELCVCKGIYPKYDLVPFDWAVHQSIFKYRVTVGDTVATGRGGSKKKAKLEAAINILIQLKSTQEYANAAPNNKETRTTYTEEVSNKGCATSKGAVSVAAVNAQLPNLNTDLMSVYDDGILGNPVGELQEICMKRRMQPPVYEVSLAEGLPHERNFVINCLVGSDFRESGCGKSKKLAKRKAASKILTALEAQPIIVGDADNTGSFGGIDGKGPSTDEDDLAQGTAQRNAVLKDQKDNDQGGVYSVSNLLQSLKVTNRHGSKLKSLQDPDLDLFSPDSITPYEKYLGEIAEEQQFTITYVIVEGKSESDKFRCFVQMATDPVAVCFGMSENTAEEARKDGAKNALEYLRIMTK